MEPEFEIAIKVGGYIELFWDGHVPQLEPHNQITHVALFDLLPPQQNDIKQLLESALSEETKLWALAAAIREYLNPGGNKIAFRKPRLWRAAKVAGLWMEPRENELDLDYPERYVCVRQDDLAFHPPDRRYQIDSRSEAGDLEIVLHKLSEVCSSRIAQDLNTLAQIFGSIPIIRIAKRRKVADPPEQPQLKAIPLSAESIRRDLAHFFCHHPKKMEQAARALEYIPSFTAELAARIVDVSGVRHWAPFGGFFEDLFCRYVFFPLADKSGSLLEMEIATFMKSKESPVEPLRGVSPIPGDHRIAATATGMVEIALGSTRTCSRCRAIRTTKRISEQTVDLLRNEIAFLLLSRLPDALAIADRLRVPVPFALAFAEELDEIENSRQGRKANGLKHQDQETYA
jgi:hypothetical protein